MSEIKSLMENISSILPDNQEINLEELKNYIYNGSMNDSSYQYICRKLPEYFLRGSSVFRPFFDFCCDTKNDKKPINTLLFKIKDGDFSDIKHFEEEYPYLVKLTKFLPERTIDRTKEIIESMLWECGECIPSSWKEEYEKYKDTYDEIIKNRGYLIIDRQLIDEHAIDRLLETEKENKGHLEFAKKIMKFYSLKDKNVIFRRFNKVQYNREKENQEKRIKEKIELEKELKTIEDKISKNNPFSRNFNRKRKEQELERKNKIISQIEAINRSISYIEKWLKEKKEDQEFLEQYKEKYIEIVHKKLLPVMKESIDKKFPEDKEKLKMLLDQFFQNVFQREQLDDTQRDPFLVLNEELSTFKGISFNDFIKKFFDALITTIGLSKVILKNNNDFYQLLNNIREQLMKVPTDEDHEKLQNEYRKRNLRSSISDFMDCTVDYEKIDSAMEYLNKEYDGLMQEEDIEEFIKKVGILWYQFMLVHPYKDGNGRTGRYLLNCLLAKKGILIPALYNTEEEQFAFDDSLDEFAIRRITPNYKELGNCFLEKIKELTTIPVEEKKARTI